MRKQERIASKKRSAKLHKRQQQELKQRRFLKTMLPYFNYEMRRPLRKSFDHLLGRVPPKFRPAAANLLRRLRDRELRRQIFG